MLKNCWRRLLYIIDIVTERQMDWRREPKTQVLRPILFRGISLDLLIGREMPRKEGTYSRPRIYDVTSHFLSSGDRSSIYIYIYTTAIAVVSSCHWTIRLIRLINRLISYWTIRLIRLINRLISYWTIRLIRLINRLISYWTIRLIRLINRLISYWTKTE